MIEELFVIYTTSGIFIGRLSKTKIENEEIFRLHKPMMMIFTGTRWALVNLPVDTLTFNSSQITARGAVTNDNLRDEYFRATTGLEIPKKQEPQIPPKIQ